MNTPKYINEKELSAMTGRALQTLRNDRFNNKGFPYVRLGRSIRYDQNECISIIEQSKVATSSFNNEGV